MAEGLATRKLPATLRDKAREVLDELNAARHLNDLRAFRSFRLEKLKGNRAGQYSILINRQYRVCFEWRNGDAFDVEIVDYH
ncbi:type II toxin-antitoxin system RelE/ParE family toxin [Marinihelvus fidelis]|uniref:type II toxin-antitoxin system RelE/ParE family toxin n=1 Tax=Marinihelvus fidelis TaxID=2613842 RepID=UPI0029665FFE|nr:type II toxin-antitoxin system RelE/ParE family toxin [Marinihelvus fidelis]